MKIQRILLVIVLMSWMVACTADKNTVDVLESYKNIQNSKEVQQDYSSKAKHYLSQAEKGDPKAMLELGVLYAYGLGVPKNYSEALRWYRLSADKGEGRAMHNIGYMYENGLDVQQNYTEAMKWYRLAADKGEIWAMSNLGSMSLLSKIAVHRKGFA